MSAAVGYTAHAPSECLNGCLAGAGDARGPVLCPPGIRICPACASRLEGWLRAIPDCYALLPDVQEHGTVPGNPETARVKNPDPPAPMRLEIVDLLDTRSERGVLGILHSWAELVRDQRRQPRRCVCGHDQLGHVGYGAARCMAKKCKCHGYEALAATVASECGYLLTNLPWITEQDWAGELYAEIKPLHRALKDAVGEYRTHPVGTCTARPAGQHETAVCGGPLFMDKTQRAVECASCGNRVDADNGLRELGLKVGLISDNDHNQQEAS